MKEICKYIVYSLVVLGICTRIISAGVDERRGELLKLVDDELIEITRLSKQISHRNPNLLIRMAELYTEKGRLIKEVENETYLTLSTDKRRGISKTVFFKDSRKWFVRAQKICMDVLKRFSDIKEKADVYYLLAYNAKEFERNREAKQYFTMATKHSSSRSETRLKANLELANIYFNEREYSKAIPIYEQTLGSRTGHESNRWWTKDSFNLAWCYFRVNRYSKAINLMKIIYQKSQSSEYIDMSSMVIRDLPLFYAESGSTKEGISFFRSIGQDISVQLKKLATILMEQGKFTKAQLVITEALKYTTDNRVIIDLTFLRLELYEKYFKVENHLQGTNVLMGYYRKGLLTNDDITKLKFQSQTMGARLQKQIIGKAFRKVEKVRNMKAQQASNYFSVLAEIDKVKSYKMLYFRAETFYAARMFNEALDAYNDSYNDAEKSSNSSYVKLSVDGMMACLAQKETSQKMKEKHYVPVYTAFLKNDSKSSEANKIFQKLFKIYFERGAVDNSISVLDQFKVNFPNDVSVQEVMITEVIEYFRRAKQNDKTKEWIAKIFRNEYRVGSKYLEKLKEILTGLQMVDAQDAVRKGQKKKALDSYIRVADDPSSTSQAKRSAFYNVSLLYLELGAIDESYLWAIKALSLMTPTEVEKFGSSFLTISTELFNRIKFENSANLSNITLEKICNLTSKRKPVLFKNSAVIYLADHKLSEAMRAVLLAEKCKIESLYVDEIKFEILNDLVDRNSWTLYAKILDDLSRRKENHPKLIKHLSVYCDSNAIQTAAKTKCKDKMITWYEQARKTKSPIPLESLDIIAEAELLELQRIEGQLHKIQLSFPEKVYHNLLRQKFHLLDKLTINALRIFDIGSGKGIVDAYKILIESYKKIAQDIRSFVPTNKSKDYIAAFQKDMIKITDPLLVKASENEKRAISQIAKYKILSDTNWEFIGPKLLPLKLRFTNDSTGIVMDRRGGR